MVTFHQKTLFNDTSFSVVFLQEMVDTGYIKLKITDKTKIISSAEAKMRLWPVWGDKVCFPVSIVYNNEYDPDHH